MSYMQIKYDDNDNENEKKDKRKLRNNPSCLTCREDNPQSYICSICHNCSEWHR